MTLFSLEASLNLANPTPQQENDLVRRMRDTSGQRCLERFGRFSHVGSWAKTFSDLLIGQEGWFSTRCKLTWRLKGTKYNRMFFQLYPSTLPTAGIESSLWPTPRAQEPGMTSEGYGACLNDVIHGRKMNYLLPNPTTQEPTSECEINENGRRLTTNGKDSHSLNIGRMAAMGMLPTPTCMDATNATATMKSTQVKEGSMHSVTLTRAMAMGMLPTPTSQDQKHSTTKSQSWEKRIEQKHLAETVLNPYIQENGGTPSHLSPQFVLEMMGFPTDWTLLPFLSGETNPSKQEETQ